MFFLLGFLKIHFVTQDKKGFAISKKRIVTDMKYPLDLVKTLDRVEWMKKKMSLNKIIYSFFMEFTYK